MKTLWIIFENNCPECGKYEDVDFAADVLDQWEDQERENIKQTLLNLPIGVLTIIKGKRVVKVNHQA